MEELLAELAALSAEFPDGFAAKPLKNPNNKWLVRSALQKAIRRGQTSEALAMAQYMLGGDVSYAWQSLAIICVEDIGIGDLDALAYSTVLTLKTVRDKLDSDLLYGAMVARICAGPKSRCCCELELGVNMVMGQPDKYTGVTPDTPYRQIMNKMLNQHPEELLAYIGLNSTEFGALEYCQLANLALRKKLRGQGEEALIPALTMIRDNLDDPSEQRAAMFSFERTVDTMNLALFPVLKWLNLRNEEIFENDEKKTWPTPTAVGPFWAEVFDMHTQQGKAALRAWYKHLCGITDIMKTVDGGEAYKMLGAIVFVLEGGLVDRRLCSEGLDMLKAYQDINFIRGYGASQEIMDDLNYIMKLCRDELPKLHELRLWMYSK